MTIRDGRLWLESILGEPEEKACDKKDEKEKSREYKREKKKKTDEEYIIDARDVYFSYDRNSGEVLRGLNLKVKKGEWYCLMGGNGAGKSTTLKVLCGILKPQRGNVTIDGLDVKKTGSRLFEGRLAMVPQNPQALFTEITVEEELLEALYVASGIGAVIAYRASISGAAGGCQAEIGTASAMAAGALVSLRGGTNEQIGHAVAMALKNLMGLVCDPVAGLVEVPCVKRNVIGAVNAISAADMALAGIESRIPVDEVIDAMGEVGRRMPVEFRETALGGLAATPTGKAVKERMPHGAQ